MIRVLNKFSIEIITAILFGIGACVISLLLSIIAGNKIGIAVTRAFLFTFIYAAIGYGIVLAIKRLVPEVYEVLREFMRSTKQTDQNENETVQQVEGSATSSVNDRPVEIASDEFDFGKRDTSHIDEFTPFTVSDFTNLSSVGSKSTKLGKHIVIDDKKFQYEPKLMAEAIRTMLKRDKD